MDHGIIERVALPIPVTPCPSYQEGAEHAYIKVQIEMHKGASHYHDWLECRCRLGRMCERRLEMQDGTNLASSSQGKPLPVLHCVRADSIKFVEAGLYRERRAVTRP